MSWQATAWADSLPYDTLQSYLAYRVLIKLCNNADEHGKTTWRSKKELSVELGVSERSVQRAMRELEQALLIIPGDQEYVRHIRADRRPKVYDMNLQYREATYTPELPLEAPKHGETGLSTGDPRGDNWGPHGETTAVAHRTILELPTTKTSRVTQTGAVSPSVIVASLAHCLGTKPHVFPDDDPNSQCQRCWVVRYQLEHDEQQLRNRREQGP